MKLSTAVKSIAAFAAVTAAGVVIALSAGGSSAEDDLRRAAYAHLEAINNQDVVAIKATTTKKCDDTDQEIRERLDLLDQFFGDLHFEDLDITRMNDEHTRAMVNGTFGIEALDKDSDGGWWVVEDGRWKVESC